MHMCARHVHVASITTSQTDASNTSHMFPRSNPPPAQVLSACDHPSGAPYLLRCDLHVRSVHFGSGSAKACQGWVLTCMRCRRVSLYV